MRQTGIVEKGWGSEDIWETNDLYCGKMMHFNKGGKSSMHFHRWKDETWYVLSGRFLVRWIDTEDASLHEHELMPKSTRRNMPMVPHQIICLEAGTIMEVSTPDSVEDNYRVYPGDSQESYK